jgi:hypothetical protein
VLLYRDGKKIWRQGKDFGGEIDIAVIELERSTLPLSVVLQRFTHATSNARCRTWKSALHCWS